MNLVFDAHAITAKRSGIGEYSYELCREFVNGCDGRINLNVFANHTITRVRSCDELDAAVAGTPEGALYSAGHQRSLPKLLAGNSYDLFHSPDFMIPYFARRIPIVATIHDIVPVLMPEMLARSKKTRFPALFKFAVQSTLNRAAHVITDAQSSRRDICANLSCPPEKISVVPLASTMDVTQGTEIGSRTGGRPYVLFVGRRDPYKGLSLLLDALCVLRSSGGGLDFVLRVAGPPDDRYSLTDRIHSGGLDNDVEFCGYVPDDELARLYSGSLALVLPSLYEGFGFPVLDAMRLGVPVLCSNRGSLPELAVDAALIADPEDSAVFASALHRITHDEEVRRTCIERGRARASSFSWRRTAEMTIAVYESVLARRKG
jgi:glycosyltransferase involved in cell wall biosynthesis